MLTLKKINLEITRVSRLQNRRDVRGIAAEAYLAPSGTLFICSASTTNVNNYERVRRFVAINLGVNDIYEGNKGKMIDGVMHGHFDPLLCKQIN